MPADILDVPGEIAETMALVRENRLRLETAMTASTKFDAKHVSALGSLAASEKALSTESRLWAEVIRKLGESATPEQRTAAAIAHLSALPVGLRAKAYAELIAAESHALNGLPLRLENQP